MLSNGRWHFGVALALSGLLVISLASSSEASVPNKRAPALQATGDTIIYGDPEEPALEATARQVAHLAAAKSALGYYWDRATSEFVVVLPESGPGSNLSPADFSSLNIRIRLARLNITQARIDSIKQRIVERAWHPAARQYAYGFYYDLRRGVMHLGTNAPAEVVAPLLQEYPGVIEYIYGWTGRD